MTRKIPFLFLVILTMMTMPAYAFEKPGGGGHFAWGAELGPSIDLCGDDMSTIDLGGYLGWRNDFVDFVGVGVGINMLMSHSGRFFPVYAGFRSSFSRKHKLVFFDARVGCTFASANERKTQRVLYVAPGIGFNLAGGPSYQSYILVNYSYCGLEFDALKKGNEVKGVNRVGLTIGVTF